MALSSPSAVQILLLFLSGGTVLPAGIRLPGLTGFPGFPGLLRAAAVRHPGGFLHALLHLPSAAVAFDLGPALFDSLFPVSAADRIAQLPGDQPYGQSSCRQKTHTDQHQPQIQPVFQGIRRRALGKIRQMQRLPDTCGAVKLLLGKAPVLIPDPDDAQRGILLQRCMKLSVGEQVFILNAVDGTADGQNRADGFSTFMPTQVISDAQSFGQFHVTGGDSDVQGRVKESVSTVLPIGSTIDNIQYEYLLTDGELHAPLQKDTSLGIVRVWYQNRCLAQQELYSSADVREPLHLADFPERTPDAPENRLELRLVLIGMGLLAAAGLAVWLIVRQVRYAIRRRNRKKRVEKRRAEIERDRRRRQMQERMKEPSRVPDRRRPEEPRKSREARQPRQPDPRRQNRPSGQRKQQDLNRRRRG